MLIAKGEVFFILAIGNSLWSSWSSIHDPLGSMADPWTSRSQPSGSPLHLWFSDIGRFLKLFHLSLISSPAGQRWRRLFFLVSLKGGMPPFFLLVCQPTNSLFISPHGSYGRHPRPVPDSEPVVNEFGWPDDFDGLDAPGIRPIRIPGGESGQAILLHVASSRPYM